MSTSPLATEDQAAIERLALRLIEHSEVRAAREKARAMLLADPLTQTFEGRFGLDRALDQWVLGLAMRAANGDPHRPRVVWNIYNPARHWFGHTFLGAAVAIDNPDNTNREIFVDSSSSYRVKGRFGTPATQFMIELVTDLDGYTGVGRTISALTTQTIALDADGGFTVTVDPHEASGRPNHFRTEPGPRLIVIARDSMSDWNQVPTALSVERLDGPAPAPERSDTEVAADIAASMPVWVRFWSTFKDDFLGYPEPNKLVGPIGRPGGWGCLAGGRFCIEGTEAVVITVRDGDANYTGIQVADPWTISPDPIHRLASLNKSQARPNPDGTITYVLALRDPGVHNWIDTVGLSEGWMLLRWQGVPATTDFASLIVSVATVPLDRLASELPPGVPAIDLAGRARQIDERIRQHSRRLAL